MLTAVAVHQIKPKRLKSPAVGLVVVLKRRLRKLAQVRKQLAQVRKQLAQVRKPAMAKRHVSLKRKLRSLAVVLVAAKRKLLPKLRSQCRRWPAAPQSPNLVIDFCMSPVDHRITGLFYGGLIIFRARRKKSMGCACAAHRGRLL